MRRLLVGLSVVGVVIAAGVVAVAVKPWQSNDQPASSAELVSAQRLSFEITTNAMGELEASEQIEIRSQLDTASTIVEIVPEGTIVERGDVLVKLNTNALQTQIDEEMLRVEAAQADVDAADSALQIQISENDSRLRAAEMRVDLAQLALMQWQEGDVTKRRQDLQLAIEQAERQLRRLRDRFERSEELLKEGFVSQNERDLDEIAFIDAQARLSTARLEQQVYETYQHPRDHKSRINELEEAEDSLERTIKQNEINLASRVSALSTRQRTLELRTERLNKLLEQMELTTITAPSAGLVVYSTSMQNQRWNNNEGPWQIGSNIRSNDLIMVLPDTEVMVAAVRVHESLAGRIRRGQDAMVRVDAAGGRTFAGIVQSIGVLAETGGWRDPNRREYTVRIALQGGDGQGVLKPSMRAEAIITLAEVADAIAVPVQAVFIDGSVRYVYTPTARGYTKTPVGMGRRSDTLAEITAGLSEGDRVLVREPRPNEINEVAWTPELLRSVGYTLDENGRVVTERPRRMTALPAQRRPSSQAPEQPASQTAEATQTQATAIEKPATVAAAAPAEPTAAEVSPDSANTPEEATPASEATVTQVPAGSESVDPG